MAMAAAAAEAAATVKALSSENEVGRPGGWARSCNGCREAMAGLCEEKIPIVIYCNKVTERGCQMATAELSDCMCLALWASELWLRYATLQNLISSFPWIAPPCPPTRCNPRKRKGSNFAIWQLCNRDLNKGAICCFDYLALLQSLP